MKKREYLIILILVLFSLQTVFVYGSEINTTRADGLIAYSELNIQSARYRLWNNSNNFSAEYTALNNGGDITWVITKANHERDEIIVGTEDKANDVNIQVYNGTWSNLLEVSTDVPNSGRRAFDIAYEDISGKALIVYETSSSNDVNLGYRIWNGTGYSSAQTLPLGITASAITWVKLEPLPGTDEIMLLAHSNSNNIYAITWNGTGFVNSSGFVISTDTQSNGAQRFAFDWERTSKDGFAVYGQQNGLGYRAYNHVTRTWGSQSLVDVGGRVRSVRLCADTISDYIGILFKDLNIAQRVRMWNGSIILANNPSADTGTRRGGASNANIDCAWETSGTTAIFGFVDLVSTGNNGNEFIDYFTFTKPNTWSTSDLTSTFTSPKFTNDDIRGLRFTENPVTDEIMVVALDDAEDITAIRWNGTGFTNISASPLETSSEIVNGDQEGAYFDWYRYDTSPSVVNISSRGVNYNIGSVVDINVTVTDNINVSKVYVNITLPDGTIQRIDLLDKNNDNAYNVTFTGTSLSGTYFVKVVANDTSTHSNVNSSEISNFSVGDILLPNVTIISPVDNSVFNQSDNVTIRVNVTDNVNVSIVYTNVTLPNGTVFQAILVDQMNNISYEYNFTHTQLLGRYTVIIIANDTSNNVNDVESVVFGISDVVVPSVVDINPTPGTNFAISSVVNITVNVTDDINVSFVIANITLPDNTTNLLTLSDSDGDSVYTVLFSNTTSSGVYNVTIIANDTVNNLNNSEFTYFTIGDFVSPEITLNGPDNNSNLTTTVYGFNFTVVENNDSVVNCSIVLDNEVNQFNESVLNNTQTTFTINSISEGSHEWYVSCSDSSGNSNSSLVNRFIVDITPPQFISLVTNPSLEQFLDPGLNVTVVANVTENITSVDRVILKYKLSSESDYSSITMNLNLTDGFYYAVFNATIAGTYNLKLFANDSVGNSDESNVVNIEVDFDRTWERLPSVFDPVVANINQNVTIGNLTINNTADYSLNFSIVSNSDETVYNSSSNFSLNSGSFSTIMINESSSSVGVKTVTYTISSIVNESLNADPSSLVTTGTLIVAPGQPVLFTKFVNPDSDVLTVKQGDEDVELTAKIENIGIGNATNVSFFFTIPDEWTVTFGQLKNNFTILTPGSVFERTIGFSIPSNFTIGNYKIFVNTTAVNDSGSDLTELGLVFGDIITITVDNEILGIPEEESSSISLTTATTGKRDFFSFPSVCTTSWICNDWSICEEDKQIRECHDKNRCDEKFKLGESYKVLGNVKPLEIKSCGVILDDAEDILEEFYPFEIPYEKYKSWTILLTIFITLLVSYLIIAGKKHKKSKVNKKSINKRKRRKKS